MFKRISHLRPAALLLAMIASGCDGDAATDPEDASADGGGVVADVIVDTDTSDAVTDPVDEVIDTDDDADAPDAPEAPDTQDARDTDVDAPETNDADAPEVDVPPTDTDDADVDADLDGGDADGSGEDAPDVAPPCATTSEGTPTLELGTGLEGFVPLIGEDEVLMTEGIQGGFHLWGGLRGSGFAPEDAEASFTLENEAGESVGALVWIGDYQCDEDTEQWARFGLTVFLDFAVWPPDVEGERWELCVDATMSDGTELSDCRTVIVRCCDWLFGPPD